MYASRIGGNFFVRARAGCLGLLLGVLALVNVQAASLHLFIHNNSGSSVALSPYSWRLAQCVGGCFNIWGLSGTIAAGATIEPAAVDFGTLSPPAYSVQLQTGSPLGSPVIVGAQTSITFNIDGTTSSPDWHLNVDLYNPSPFPRCYKGINTDDGTLVTPGTICVPPNGGHFLFSYSGPTKIPIGFIPMVLDGTTGSYVPSGDNSTSIPTTDGAWTQGTPSPRTTQGDSIPTVSGTGTNYWKIVFPPDSNDPAQDLTLKQGFDSLYRTTAEGLGDIAGSIGAISTSVNNNTTAVNNNTAAINSGFVNVGGQLTTLNGLANTIASNSAQLSQLSGMATSLSSMFSQLQTLNSATGQLHTDNAATQTAIAATTTAVNAVKSSVDAVNSSLSTANGALSDIDTRVGQMKLAMDSVNAAEQATKAAVDLVNTALATQNATTASIDGRLAAEKTVLDGMLIAQGGTTDAINTQKAALSAAIGSASGDIVGAVNQVRDAVNSKGQGTIDGVAAVAGRVDSAAAQAHLDSANLVNQLGAVSGRVDAAATQAHADSLNEQNAQGVTSGRVDAAASQAHSDVANQLQEASNLRGRVDAWGTQAHSDAVADQAHIDATANGILNASNLAHSDATALMNLIEGGTSVLSLFEGQAHSDALVEEAKADAVKTSVDGVKTSTDAVKTSVDTAKTDLQTTLNGIKTAADTHATQAHQDSLDHQQKTDGLTNWIDGVRSSVDNLTNYLKGEDWSGHDFGGDAAAGVAEGTGQAASLQADADGFTAAAGGVAVGSGDASFWHLTMFGSLVNLDPRQDANINDAVVWFRRLALWGLVVGYIGWAFKSYEMHAGHVANAHGTPGVQDTTPVLGTGVKFATIFAIKIALRFALAAFPAAWLTFRTLHSDWFAAAWVNPLSTSSPYIAESLAVANWMLPLTELVSGIMGVLSFKLSIAVVAWARSMGVRWIPGA
jgi:hypothetical protein